MKMRHVLFAAVLLGVCGCTGDSDSDSDSADTSSESSGEGGGGGEQAPPDENGPKDSDFLKQFDEEYDRSFRRFNVLYEGMKGPKGIRKLPSGQIRDWWGSCDTLYEILSHVGDTANPDVRAAFAKLADFEGKIDELIQESGSQDVAREIVAEQKMPAEDVADSDELRTIATEVLANTDWDVGEIKRMVVNYGKNPGTRQFWDNLGEWQDWVWEEFQVTTAEKVGDKFFARCYEFKNYSKGGSDQGKWKVAKRVTSNRLLEENIGG